MLDLVDVRLVEHELEAALEKVRDGVHLADRAFLHEQRRDPPRGRPARVLVDGEPQAGTLRLLDHGAGGGEVDRKGFLGEDVLARRQGAADQVDAHARGSRDIDDLHARIVEQPLDRLEDGDADVVRPRGVDADDLAPVLLVRG